VIGGERSGLVHVPFRITRGGIVAIPACDMARFLSPKSTYILNDFNSLAPASWCVTGANPWPTCPRIEAFSPRIFARSRFKPARDSRDALSQESRISFVISSGCTGKPARDRCSVEVTGWFGVGVRGSLVGAGPAFAVRRDSPNGLLPGAIRFLVPLEIARPSPLCFLAAPRDPARRRAHFLRRHPRIRAEIVTANPAPRAGASCPIHPRSVRAGARGALDRRP